MSIIDNIKKSPVKWTLGLGGAALVVDYLVEGERSFASTLYHSLFGSDGGHNHLKRRAGQHGLLGGSGGGSSGGAFPYVYYLEVPYGYAQPIWRGYHNSNRPSLSHRLGHAFLTHDALHGGSGSHGGPLGRHGGKR